MVGERRTKEEGKEGTREGEVGEDKKAGGREKKDKRMRTRVWERDDRD